MRKLKVKIYNKLVASDPKLERFWVNYKFNNLELHKKHKITSLNYLRRLISARKKNIDFSKVKLPKNAYNPTPISLNDEVYKNNNGCTAIPDSQLLKRKTVKELLREFADCNVVSFDIFDTCIFRPFAKPTDLFYLLEAENGILNFSDIRIAAEWAARRKTTKPNFEVDIYDIYEELSHRVCVKKEEAEKEIELEKDVCYANPYMLEVFKAFKKAGKKVLAVSDMYLPKTAIKAMLDKCGFVGFDKIYVSCEYGCSKSNGKLYDIVKNDYLGKNIMHIGDNINSDIANAKKAGLKTYFYQQCNAFGNPFRPQSLISPVSAVYKGIVNNYMYSGANKNSAREDFGFIYAGPVVCGMCEWVNEFSKNNNLDKIFFLARDMEIFYKVYNKHFKEYENEYVTTSRFSLQEFMVKDFPDEYFFHTISSRSNKGYTIEKALNEINLDFLADECKNFGLNKKDIILNDKLEKIEEMFKTNKDRVIKNFEDNEKAAKQYFKKVIGKSKRLCVVDLGWRGSIIAYLKYLLVEKWKLCEEVKGVLVGSTITTTSVNLISRGVVTSYAYNNTKNREFLKNANWNAEYINSYVIESVFSSEDSTLVEYRLNKETGETEFFKYNGNPNAPFTREFQTGIMRFADEFEDFRKKYRQHLPMSAVDAFDAIFNISNNYEYIARIVGNVVDSPFGMCGLNLKKKDYVEIGELLLRYGMIKHWPLQ